MKLSRRGTGTAGTDLVRGRPAERAVARGTTVAMAAIVLLASNHAASAQSRTPIVGTGAVFNPGTFQVVIPPFIDRPVKIEGWGVSPTNETLLALGADGGVSASTSRGYRFMPASSLRAIDIADGGSFGVVLREGGRCRCGRTSTPRLRPRYSIFLRTSALASRSRSVSAACSCDDPTGRSSVGRATPVAS